MDGDFMELMDSIRAMAGFPFVVTSGYRCPDHPIEARKSAPGAHTTGKAIDIAVTGHRALRLIELAQQAGIQRIGVNQKGNGRFIHLDVCDDRPSPAIWSY
jgi:zinc D-Ala-D-Ala carboxypeptidase